MAVEQTATITLESLLGSPQEECNDETTATPFDSPSPCVVRKPKRGRDSAGKFSTRYGTSIGFRSDSRGLFIMVEYPNGERVFEPQHHLATSDKPAHVVKN